MSNTPVPKFTYPGDDPKLDSFLNEARIEGERDLTSYPDMFGRRKLRSKSGGVAEVDQEALTNPGSPWESKESSAIDKSALPSALVPIAPTASTGPVVTETPAGMPGKTQSRWLMLGALTIIGPVTLVAIIVSRPPSLPQGASRVPSAAVSVTVTAPPSASIRATAPTMTATPILEDAGAALVAPTPPIAPTGAQPALAPKGKVRKPMVARDAGAEITSFPPDMLQ